MKGKKLNYPLLAAVLIIWGVIIYRTVSAFSSPEEPLVITPVAAKQSPDDYAIKTDTNKLGLHYHDPFGLAKPPRDSIGSIKHSRAKQTVPAISWPTVTYSGFMANKLTNRAVSLMAISGQSAMMAEGETIAGIKLIRNCKDSVQIGYMHQTKFIRRKVE